MKHTSNSDDEETCPNCGEPLTTPFEKNRGRHRNCGSDEARTTEK